VSIPENVKKILDSHNLTYDTVKENISLGQWSVHEQNLRRIGSVKSILVEDCNGKVLVIISANDLLDLKMLEKHTGRSLTTSCKKDIEAFCAKHQLISIPALPNLAGITTYVDQGVLENEFVLLDIGVNEAVLKLSNDDFSSLVERAQVCDITVNLNDLAQQYGQVDAEEQIFTAVKNFTTLRIKQRLEETLELPPLPETAQRIMQLRAVPEADISDLANIVEVDPSLAAQVVSWASSPYYSAQGDIKSIHDAIVRVLGFDMVMNLALGLALGKTMSMPTTSPEGSTPYWRQAIYTAALVEGLVTVQARDHRVGFGMAYLSGLLHNFGTLILSEVFPPHYDSICRHIEVNSHVPQHLVEFHVLGISREQISSWLMNVWNMPEEVVFALRHQSHPDCDGAHENYAKLLYLAQAMLQTRGIGCGSSYSIENQLFIDLHIDQQKALTALENLMASEEQLNSIADTLNNA
jgi:HD-like signal output (HDOD) protein/prolyl-tRNA editing enzyme YbaK/EbsC (Cys-tRNA(Pro) deacylase)